MTHLNSVDTRRLAEAKAASLAPATQQTYASAWNSWVRYAEKHRDVCLPAEPEALEGWLVDLDAQGKAPDTIRTYHAAVAWHHRHLNPNPAHHPDVRDTLRGFVRLAAQEGRTTRQAEPLRQHHIDQIAITARDQRRNQPGGRIETAEQARLRGDLDIAMVLVAYDAALRASELLALEWSDIESAENGPGGRVRIRHSKTDQTGKGAVVSISAQTLAALQSIRPADAQPDDRVFPFSYTTLKRRIKAAAQAAGIDPAKITTHSPRIGLAQDLAAAGASMPALMLAGRWKSADTVAQYIKHLAADHTPLAQFHRRRVQTPPAPRPASELATVLIELAGRSREMIRHRVERAKTRAAVESRNVEFLTLVSRHVSRLLQPHLTSRAIRDGRWPPPATGGR